MLVQSAQGDFQCGGSLIAEQFVLTAAHCATEEDTSTEIPASDFTLVIGVANLNAAGPGNVYGVSDVTVHPGWAPLVSDANDAAVLRLNTPVPAAVALPVNRVGSGDTRYDGPGQGAAVAGWGTTSEAGDATNQLLETRVLIDTDDACTRAYGGEFVQPVMICASFPGRDSCQGDSGGLLLGQDLIGFKSKKASGGKHGKHGKHGNHGKNHKKKKVALYQETQMGIVSFGQGCARPGFPGVYTRLSSPVITDFINGVVSGG